MGRTRAAGISNPGYNHSRQADKILNALQRLLSISLVKAIRAVARSRIRRFLRVPCPDLFFGPCSMPSSPALFRNEGAPWTFLRTTINFSISPCART